MTKRSGLSINDGIYWRVSDVASCAKKADEAHDVLIDARDEIARDERILASGSEDLEDAEYAASLRENVAEQRERLRKAHAQRVKALEDAVSCAQHALALVKFRDPEATDALGEQPDGGETGLVWVGHHYV
jgi:hypothetical protein